MLRQQRCGIRQGVAPTTPLSSCVPVNYVCNQGEVCSKNQWLTTKTAPRNATQRSPSKRGALSSPPFTSQHWVPLELAQNSFGGDQQWFVSTFNLLPLAEQRQILSHRKYFTAVELAR